jgi:hypothetical protein
MRIQFPDHFIRMDGMWGVMYENCPEAQNFGRYLYDALIIDSNPASYQGLKVFFGIKSDSRVSRLEYLINELSGWNPADPKWGPQERV